ncbi:hypothetical protein C8J56DRAFT_1160142 [Mycena floridula]|nr:hypothetical protein C8J56DRAFT_1160142 [Mycena floridula]
MHQADLQPMSQPKTHSFIDLAFSFSYRAARPYEIPADITSITTAPLTTALESRSRYQQFLDLLPS